MIGHHYLVGSIAMVLGLCSLAAALKNEERFFQLNKLRLLQAAVGRSWSRWICGLLGLGLIIISIFIINGWLPRKPTTTSKAIRQMERTGVGVAYAC
jgi:hypothetical protein